MAKDNLEFAKAARAFFNSDASKKNIPSGKETLFNAVRKVAGQLNDTEFASFIRGEMQDVVVKLSGSEMEAVRGGMINLIGEGGLLKLYTSYFPENSTKPGSLL